MENKMNKKFSLFLILTAISALLVTGCMSSNVIQPTAEATQSALQSSPATESTPVVPEKLVIYAPASTSSIPVIIAANRLKNVDLQLYNNQSQANTLFLRGDVSILVSGLSVGMDLYKNEAPIKVINSFVSGLSYLVTYGKPVDDLAALKGKEVYFPFEGSPIEEVTFYLAKEKDLTWKTDIIPIYSPFESSIELLKQGKAEAVILPEPSVTLVEGKPDIYISLSLFDLWNEQTQTSEGYPQVATFVNPDWAAAHSEQVNEFNTALSEAIAYVQQNPEAAAQEVQTFYKLPADKLLKSLGRTRYHLTTGSGMQTEIQSYYQTIGKPLDENFTDFYFIPAQ